MDYGEIIKKLEGMKNARNVEGMARFGIRPKTRVLGIPIPETRKLAKQIGKNHDTFRFLIEHITNDRCRVYMITG